MIKEQQSDMYWANDVLTGQGDEADSRDVAVNLLTHLALSGVTPEIKDIASIMLQHDLKRAS